MTTVPTAAELTECVAAAMHASIVSCGIYDCLLEGVPAERIPGLLDRFVEHATNNAVQSILFLERKVVPDV